MFNLFKNKKEKCITYEEAIEIVNKCNCPKCGESRDFSIDPNTKKIYGILRGSGITDEDGGFFDPNLYHRLVSVCETCGCTFQTQRFQYSKKTNDIITIYK